MTQPKTLFVLVFSLFLSALAGHAQSLTQTLRGTVVDKVSQVSLPGATVVVLGTDPLLGTSTDENGAFRLTRVPIGTHTLRISFIGYKDVTLTQLQVNSGKELILTIPMEEDYVTMAEVVITHQEKNKPLNEMAAVSARTFSVEETRKYAASVNDPARMVNSFAGVVAADDGNNAISIRGNTPNGLLWRLEGIDIPNPNHYSNVGSAGGGIMILSTQLLANSDFMTGAFPAEYGNALSGVFDLRMRKGNDEKHEYFLQAGLLGLDAGIEGPLAKNSKGSFVANYRYSTLSILGTLGLPLMDAVTNFQDLTFNAHLPTEKAGSFTLFGFGGLSDQTHSGALDLNDNPFDWKFLSNTGAIGLKHGAILSKNTHLQTTLLGSGFENGYREVQGGETGMENRFINKKITLSSVASHKVNARLHMRSGMYLNHLRYNMFQQDEIEQTGEYERTIGAEGSTQSVQLFSQWNYRAGSRWVLNGGLHYYRLLLNQSQSLEPRASVQYELTESQTLSLGYGLHSQMQPLGTYFVTHSALQTNRQLDLTRSHHLVAGYDRALSPHLRVKLETYFQHLFDIPVGTAPGSTFALINSEWGFATEPLANEGIGRNYGAELTLEQFTHKNVYFLLSTSLYQSEYKALDDIWRSTRFNGRYSVAFTAGKDFMGSNHRTYGVNFRTLWMGGLRETPIDVEQSMEKGETVRHEHLAFTQKVPDYFRTDLRLSMQRNREKSTHTLALDVQNTTNHQNIFGRYFDPKEGKVKNWYQMPLLPILSYKVEF
jgi:hypothetical protein